MFARHWHIKPYSLLHSYLVDENKCVFEMLLGNEAVLLLLPTIVGLWVQNKIFSTTRWQCDGESSLANAC